MTRIPNSSMDYPPVASREGLEEATYEHYAGVDAEEAEVERVAEAIYSERYVVEVAFGAMPPWADADESERSNTRDEARAAIAAMRAKP